MSYIIIKYFNPKYIVSGFNHTFGYNRTGDSNFLSDYCQRKEIGLEIVRPLKDSDVIIVKFGEKYKQWNAAFDAGYAAALNKSIIIIHNEDHQHALKEVDAAAAAVASDQKQAVRILKYVLQGKLK